MLFGQVFCVANSNKQIKQLQLLYFELNLYKYVNTTTTNRILEATQTIQSQHIITQIKLLSTTSHYPCTVVMQSNDKMKNHITYDMKIVEDTGGHTERPGPEPFHILHLKTFMVALHCQRSTSV